MKMDLKCFPMGMEISHTNFHASGQITDLLNWMTFGFYFTTKATLFKEISTKLVTHPR